MKEHMVDRRSTVRLETNKRATVCELQSGKVFEAELTNVSTGGYGINIGTDMDLVGKEILIFAEDVVDSCVVIRQSYGAGTGSFIGAKIIELNKQTLYQYLNSLKAQRRTKCKRKVRKFSYYPGKFRIK